MRKQKKLKKPVRKAERQAKRHNYERPPVEVWLERRGPGKV